MAMYYYDLDVNGRILARYSMPQSDIPGLLLLDEPPTEEYHWTGSAWEPVDTSHEDALRHLRETDLAMARVVDELIDILVPATITLDDLSTDTRALYEARKTSRETL